MTDDWTPWLVEHDGEAFVLALDPARADEASGWCVATVRDGRLMIVAAGNGNPPELSEAFFEEALKAEPMRLGHAIGHGGEITLPEEWFQGGLSIAMQQVLSRGTLKAEELRSLASAPVLSGGPPPHTLKSYSRKRSQR